MQGTFSWVGTATPASIWRFAGVLLWIIGAVVLFVMA